jgi:hypothetical protein
VTYVDLIEHHLFGLAILIGKTRLTTRMFLSVDFVDNEYYFPAMDIKISKLVDDSKWKAGQATFVMQLKIKYFVTDINLFRSVPLNNNEKKKKTNAIIVLLFLDIFLRNISSIYDFDNWFSLIRIK